MNIIDKKVKKLEDFQKNEEQIILDLTKEFEDLILDMNTLQLSEKGIDSEGEDITPGYRPMTISIKEAKGQPTDRVTLRDTGKFHDSFFVVYGPTYFAIGSDDPKAKKLEKKYGPEIFGLIDENIQELINQIRPGLLEKLKNLI